MREFALEGRHILVVEDEYILADDLHRGLEREGAVVIGPFGRLEDVLAVIEAGGRIDAAVLDVNLDGVQVFPAVEMLLPRGVPIVFTTGYDASSIPSQYGHIIRCEKPVKTPQLIDALARASADSE